MIVFAYASLVSAPSAAATLGREVMPEPATLRGHRRDWSVARDNETSEKIFELAGGERPAWLLALNLVPAQRPGAECNGALIEVSAEELGRLARRELRYRPLTLAAGSFTADPEIEAVTFVARPEHHHPVPPNGAVIARAYAEAVESAFTTLGPGQRSAYIASTAPPPVPVVEVKLVSGAAEPGNPTAW